MITNWQEGLEVLRKMYSPRKLSLMGIKRDRHYGINKHIVEEVILLHCFKDFSHNNDIDVNYVFQLCCEDAGYQELIGLMNEILEKNEFKQELIVENFKKLASRSESETFRKYSWQLADLLWPKVSEKNRLQILQEINIFSYKNVAENLLYYFYKKNVINFTKPYVIYGEDGKINRRHDIPYISLDFAKKVKVKYTDDLIKNIIERNKGLKRYVIEGWIKYFFTIPELKKKLDKTEWKLHSIGWGKLIDYYPEEEKQKYIDKLLSEYKKTKDKSLVH